MKPYRNAAGLALALALVAAPLQAQQAFPAPQALPDSIQELVTEFQTLRERLAELQDSAFQSNPALVEDRQAVQEFVEQKMAEEHPTLEEDVARMQALQQEMAQAQAAQDTARVEAIVEEGTRIGQELEAAQAATMEREDVQARVEAFEAQMVDAMAAIDPTVQQALTRIEEIAGRLQAFQQGG